MNEMFKYLAIGTVLLGSFYMYTATTDRYQVIAADLNIISGYCPNFKPEISKIINTNAPLRISNLDSFLKHRNSFVASKLKNITVNQNKLLCTAPTVRVKLIYLQLLLGNKVVKI